MTTSRPSEAKTASKASLNLEPRSRMMKWNKWIHSPMFIRRLRAAPSVGFVQGMLARAARLLTEAHQRIRALMITLVHEVSCDETPL